MLKEFFEFLFNLFQNQIQEKKLPSRRFNCLRCGVKCRSSIQDRGKRKYCKRCEEENFIWKRV